MGSATSKSFKQRFLFSTTMRFWLRVLSSVMDDFVFNIIPLFQKSLLAESVEQISILAKENLLQNFLSVTPSPGWTKAEILSQLIPGHEIVGTVVELGKEVDSGTLKVGDRCVVDPSLTCGLCFYCRRGQPLLCENYEGLGCTMSGGFAEYAVARENKVFKIHNLTDEDATLIEPAACAVHGADKLALPVGAEVLILGAGPTGLILAQLLKLNGASRIVIAANKGIKTNIARQLEVADDYIEIDRDSEDQDSQWAGIKDKYPYGFDAVVEATGSERIANLSIQYVRRGGTLMVYGVYANDSLVHWSPSFIFANEIKIIGSFAQMNCFPRAIAYLDSGKVKVSGMVTDTFTIKQYQQALEKLTSRTALKVVVKP